MKINRESGAIGLPSDWVEKCEGEFPCNLIRRQWERKPSLGVP